MRKIVSATLILFVSVTILGFGTKITRAQSNSVDLVWEAETYTPYWYKGKALYRPGSNVRIVAIPHVFESSGSGFETDQLRFTWSRDGVVLGSLSGIGKDTLSINTSQIDNRIRINIEVSSFDESQKAFSRVIIEDSEEELLVYEEDPLYGLLENRSVGRSFNMTSSEVSFTAIPFFFNVENPLTPLLNWTWRLNNDVIESNDNSVVFKRASDVGRARTSVGVEHSNFILESDSYSFDIIFQ